MLENLNVHSWKGPFSPETQSVALTALERGSVVHFPELPFPFLEEEKKFYSPSYVDPKRKNISYQLDKDLLGGALCEEEAQLKALLRRYAETSLHFVRALFPCYTPFLRVAKTSFRPVEIAGRKTSPRKDDKRLHVDAFPSSPTKGMRILRLFTNVNPEGLARVWRVGEPFSNVVKHFAPQVRKPLPVSALLLQLLKITKGRRTPYDHYMLGMHNRMKEDLTYQKTVSQEEIRFLPGSSWMVYTDQVSHAALSGQHVLEQTFHVPLEGLNDPHTAPLKVLEKFLQKSAV